MAIDIIAVIQMMIMPDQMTEISDSMMEIFGGVPAVIGMLIVSVSPGAGFLITGSWGHLYYRSFYVAFLPRF